MASVLTIEPSRPSGGAVEVLEDLLARARRGELRSIAVATTNTERCVATCYFLEEQLGTEPHALVGALERLKMRLLLLDGGP